MAFGIWRTVVGRGNDCVQKTGLRFYITLQPRLKRMSVNKSNYSFTLVRFQQKRKIIDVSIVRERQTRRELWMIPAGGGEKWH